MWVTLKHPLTWRVHYRINWGLSYNHIVVFFLLLPSPAVLTSLQFSFPRTPSNNSTSMLGSEGIPGDPHELLLTCNPVSSVVLTVLPIILSTFVQRAYQFLMHYRFMCLFITRFFPSQNVCSTQTGTLLCSPLYLQHLKQCLALINNKTLSEYLNESFENCGGNIEKWIGLQSLVTAKTMIEWWNSSSTLFPG